MKNKILIVDDDRIIAMAEASFLNKNGYNTMTAGTGEADSKIVAVRIGIAHDSVHIFEKRPFLPIPHQHIAIVPVLFEVPKRHERQAVGVRGHNDLAIEGDVEVIDA